MASSNTAGRGAAILTLGLLLAAAASSPAIAQSELLDIAGASGEAGGALTTRVMQLFIGVTVLSLAPGIAMMVTCLPFMLIVLSILRQGVGLQQTPPNMLIVSIALFLTFNVMEPEFVDAYEMGVAPLLQGQIDEGAAFERTMAPLSEFMRARVNPEALVILHEARGGDGAVDISAPPLALLVPSFVLSEIQRAFEIGFVVLLPFLIIDLIIASILMAMGMLMVPPAIVSLPFKVVFFVLTNGWVAVSGALVRGYAS